VKLSEEEIQKLSPMRRPIVNKPLGIAYGTGELPAMIASSRDYHAYRSQGHVPGDLIPIANTNHFTILDELRQPNSTLNRAVIAMAEYQTAERFTACIFASRLHCLRKPESCDGRASAAKWKISFKFSASLTSARAFDLSRGTRQVCQCRSASASTTFEVPKLAREGAPLEVEAIA